MTTACCSVRTVWSTRLVVAPPACWGTVMKRSSARQRPSWRCRIGSIAAGCDTSLAVAASGVAYG
eukprot:5525364-Prymnesium_polylepis.2